MTNATMTRDEAATLYREMRSVAVREFGWTADEFDQYTRGLGQTPADFVRAAELLLEHARENRGMPQPEDEATAHAALVARRKAEADAYTAKFPWAADYCEREGFGSRESFEQYYRAEERLQWFPGCMDSFWRRMDPSRPAVEPTGWDQGGW